MRRMLLLAAGLAALLAAGTAVAHLKQTGVTPAAADFTATTAAKVDTRSCTNEAGDTIETTRGTWTGTATSTTAQLAGPVELRVTSVYNVTKKIGTVEGWLKIRSGEGRTNSKLWAVNADGTLDGFTYGVAGGRDARLLGSVTAGFSRAGGFTAGKLGSGTSANTAVLAGRLGCKPSKPKIGVRLFVRGEVTAVSADSISVRPRDNSAVQTCALRSASDARGATVGNDVEMHCAQIAGVMTLVKLRKRGD